MSKLVTDRQLNIIVNHLGGVFDDRPNTHEALEWFREVKVIHSGVIPLFKLDKVHYGYRYFDMKDGKPINRKESYLFDTHSLAESALLDALIEYVSK